MNLSKRWLNEYVKLNITDKQFADEMTLSGSKVESYEREGEGIKNVVVGKVLSLEKHPDSDHLWICQIDVGGADNLQIVTGAQNLKVGDIVPVALDNSMVHGGKEIKAGKLRGVDSFGMLCSLGELGLTLHDFPYAAEDGIFVLGDDCDKTLGIDILDAIGFNDVITEFEITSNRPDCLSVIGLAHEASATFDVPLDIKEPVVKPGKGDVKDLLKVSISAPDKCYRYVGAVVENVRVAPSPRWLRERLRASGVRPINNIVDITNYVMLEYGQPMHAFDLRFLKDNQVIVRLANKGEKITTLDDVERELADDMLVIADSEKPVAVAGVMGGEYSGIMDDTTTIVFESACFNGFSVRSAAKRLGMRTEASARFEKELDPNGCLRNLNRALELVQLFDAGDVVNGVVDCYPTPKAAVTLPFDWEWINRFIGIDLSADEQQKLLEKLDFTVSDGKVTAPTWRGDIEHLADVSEEVARLFGYQNIPDRPLGGVANASLTPVQQFQRTVSSTLLACGLSEVSTYSFISPKAYDKIALPADSELRNYIVISNPLGEDTSVMRTTALPSIMEVLSRNFNNRNQSAKIFELSTVYFSRGTEELPIEKQMISLGMYGDCDFFTLKGVVEELLETAGIKEYDVETFSTDPSFHPGRTGQLIINGKPSGIMGEIHPKVLENYGIDTPAYVAMLDFNTIFENRDAVKVYKHLPKFPATTRDLAAVCDSSTTVASLEKAIASAVGNILEKISLFDVYQGSQIATGKKSVAFNLMLRSTERTLTDDEADSAIKRAVEALKKIGADIRS